MSTPSPEDFDEQARRYRDLASLENLLSRVDGAVDERARLEARRAATLEQIREWDARFAERAGE